jgi:hypothetical protein
MDGVGHRVVAAASTAALAAFTDADVAGRDGLKRRGWEEDKDAANQKNEGHSRGQ